MRSLPNLHGLANFVALCATAFVLTAAPGLSADETSATTKTTVIAAPVGIACIKVEPAELDLGELPEGTIAEFTYTISNTGDGPLEISDIKATCGCTNVEMEKRLLAPGESAELTGSFNTQQRLGRQIKDITLNTNDPKHKRLTLEFKAHVYQDIVIEPTFLMLGTVLRQTGDEKHIRIRAWTDPPLEIKNIRVVEENQPLQVTLLDRKVDLRENDASSTGPLTVIDLVVTVPKGAPITNLTGTIQLETNNKTRPTLGINFQGHIAGDVFANPTRVYFGASQPGVTLTKVVTLTSRSQQPFAIESIEPGALDIGMKPLTEGEQVVHKIELSMKIPDDGEGRIRDEVTLKIKHPTMDTLQLQVTAIARPPRPENLSEKIDQARVERAKANRAVPAPEGHKTQTPMSEELE